MAEACTLPSTIPCLAEMAGLEDTVRGMLSDKPQCLPTDQDAELLLVLVMIQFTLAMIHMVNRSPMMGLVCLADLEVVSAVVEVVLQTLLVASVATTSSELMNFTKSRPRITCICGGLGW